MPRAKRYFLPGYVWHITHRCHKREFLLRFGRDRRSLVMWLFEARKRYGLRVLNYIVTSNHIHLLVLDNGEREVIPRSMQLIAGRAAQQFNRRKDRNGAFWEDRYHATAVETDHHLVSCMSYIDLNMVRAGVVAHPSQWAFAGYSEIRKPRERYSIIDHRALLDLLDLPSIDALQRAHEIWVDEALARAEQVRESKWTESVAVGSRDFVEAVKTKLGVRAKQRRFYGSGDDCTLREPRTPYR